MPYDQGGGIKMGPELFTFVAVCFLIFIYKIVRLALGKMPDETKAFVSRLAQLIPSFADSRNSDLKSFGFCVAVMIFVILLIESLLR